MLRATLRRFSPLTAAQFTNTRRFSNEHYRGQSHLELARIAISDFRFDTQQRAQAFFQRNIRPGIGHLDEAGEKTLQIYVRALLFPITFCPKLNSQTEAFSPESKPKKQSLKEIDDTKAFETAQRHLNSDASPCRAHSEAQKITDKNKRLQLAETELKNSLFVSNAFDAKTFYSNASINYKLDEEGMKSLSIKVIELHPQITSIDPGFPKP